MPSQGLGGGIDNAFLTAVALLGVLVVGTVRPTWVAQRHAAFRLATILSLVGVGSRAVVTIGVVSAPWATPAFLLLFIIEPVISGLSVTLTSLIVVRSIRRADSLRRDGRTSESSDPET